MPNYVSPHSTSTFAYLANHPRLLAARKPVAPAKLAKKKAARVRPLSFAPGAWAHLRPATPPPAIETRVERPVRPNKTALAILRAGARANGEMFDATSYIAAPSQQRSRVSGNDILRVARRMGLTKDASP